MLNYLVFIILNLIIIMLLTKTIKYIWIVLLLFVIIGIINIVFYNYRYTNIPLWKKCELIEYFMEGDIIFTNYATLPIKSWWAPATFFNGGLNHPGLIVEENNEKFIVHGIPDKIFKYDKKHVISKLDYDLFQNWEIVKQPLSEFIYNFKEKSVCTVYRSPTKNKIDLSLIEYKPLLFNTFFYCTILVGDILINHNYIKPSKTYFRHTSDDLVQNLLEQDYTQISCRF